MTPKKYAAIRDKLDSAESELARAMRKWLKLREQERRAHRALDKDFAERSERGAGELDWTDLSDRKQRRSK
jgi:hypothetical protein